MIVGGGAAGLSLAAHLAAGGWDDRRVVVVDDGSADGSDDAPAHGSADGTADGRRPGPQVWGCWSDRPLLPDDATARSWDAFAVHAGGRTARVALGGYRYHLVRRPAFATAVGRVLAHAPRFEQVQALATAVHDGRDVAAVEVDGRLLEAAWVFDAAGLWPDVPRRDHGHRLEFAGRWVATPVDAFDADLPVLADFRLPGDRDGGRAAFVHVLPVDRRHALVEHTAYLPPDAAPLPAGHVDAALTWYLREVLHVVGAETVTTECGTIPLRPWTVRHRGHRVLPVGAAAGLVRASSGYGFTAVQRDAAAVARSLVVHGHPFDVPARPWRHRVLDAVFLRALERDPGTLETAFAAMFSAPDPLRVLRFLDDASTGADDVGLVAGLPPGPFLRALLPRRSGGRAGRRVEEDLLHAGVAGDQAPFGLVRDPLQVVGGAAVGELDLRGHEQPAGAEHRRHEHRDGDHLCH